MRKITLAIAAFAMIVILLTHVNLGRAQSEPLANQTATPIPTPVSGQPSAAPTPEIMGLPRGWSKMPDDTGRPYTGITVNGCGLPVPSRKCAFLINYALHVVGHPVPTTIPGCAELMSQAFTYLKQCVEPTPLPDVSPVPPDAGKTP
jgi:hypothetical protein